MSSAEQYIRTEHPVIDSDPHFTRVVRYMRGSDVAAWGGLTVGAPAVLLALGKGSLPITIVLIVLIYDPGDTHQDRCAGRI